MPTTHLITQVNFLQWFTPNGLVDNQINLVEGI